MRWACTAREVGRPVAFRLLPDGDAAAPGEFVSTTDPSGLVLAEDLHSLRPATPAEVLTAAREAKLAELVAVRDAAIVSP